jgi:hypothetical protein
VSHLNWNYWVFGCCPSTDILETRKQRFRNWTYFCVFLVSRIQGDGRSTKNPVILSVIHHRQNPLESKRQLVMRKLMNTTSTFKFEVLIIILSSSGKQINYYSIPSQICISDTK